MSEPSQRSDPAKAPGGDASTAPGSAATRPRSGDRLTHLQAVTEALATALTPEDVAQAVVARGVQALAAHAGMIALLMEGADSLQIVGNRGFAPDVVERLNPIPLSAPMGMAAAVRTGEIVLAGSQREMAQLFPESVAIHEELGNRAYAAIPLILQGRPHGVMGLGFAEETDFSEDDVSFMRTIARQCALALERARLYEAERTVRAQAEEGQRRYSFLAEASRLLASSLDYQATLNAIARAVAPELADWCAVDLVGNSGAIEHLAMAHKDPARVAWARALQEHAPATPDPERGIGKVLRTGEPEFIERFTEDMIPPEARDEESLEILRELGLLSVLLVPLTARGRTLGVITLVTTTESGKIYTPQDLALAQDLAQRAATAVDNSRLYQDAQAAIDRHQNAEQRLATLTEASGALLSSLSLADLLPLILHLSERLFTADAYALWRADRDSKTWRVVCHSGLSAGFADTVLPWRESRPAILSEPVIVEDTEASPTLSVRSLAYQREGIRAVLVAPLAIRGDPSGTLAFYYRQPRSFSDTDVRVASAIANLASAAIGTAQLYEEQQRLQGEAQTAAARQRAFIRDVLASVTEGKLFLCATARDLPKRLAPTGAPIALARDTSLRTLRGRASDEAQRLGFSVERRQDLVTAVSEAAMNAVTHAGGGRGQVRADATDRVQVWIQDHGRGIDVAHLPRATLEKGFTTAGSLGHGMKIMLSTVDRVWLLTGPKGTTVVLEQDRVSPQTEWD